MTLDESLSRALVFLFWDTSAVLLTALRLIVVLLERGRVCVEEPCLFFSGINSASDGHEND